MRGMTWRAAACVAFVTSCALGGLSAHPTQSRAASGTSTPTATPRPAATPRPTSTPAPARPQALAYVANGQVIVFEGGTLTTVGVGQSPFWSPNGAELAYSVDDFRGNTADVYVADTHGANAKHVVAKVYPYINPSWTADSKYIVYTTPVSGQKATAPTLRLQVRAIRPDGTGSLVLGQVTVDNRCATTGTALQIAGTNAQGSYRGYAGTLVWGQPSLIVVQSSCTGQGLMMFKIGKKPTTLATWSAGALSPDGKTVAASVAPAGKGGAQLGLITIATGKTRVVKAAVSPDVLTWARDSRSLFVASQPANPANGKATIARIDLAGERLTNLGQVPASGVYHLNSAHGDVTLAMAVVANGPATTPAPPAMQISLVNVTPPSKPINLFVSAAQPAWRP
jgi:hypothetical protein